MKAAGALAALALLIVPLMADAQQYDCLAAAQRAAYPYGQMVAESQALLTPHTNVHPDGRGFDDWIDAPQALEAKRLRAEGDAGLARVVERYRPCLETRDPR